MLRIYEANKEDQMAITTKMEDSYWNPSQFVISRGLGPPDNFKWKTAGRGKLYQKNIYFLFQISGGLQTIFIVTWYNMYKDNGTSTS